MMRVVAELMIMANAAVGRRVAAAFPRAALLRRHPPPRREALAEVAALCGALGRPLDLDAGPAALAGSLAAAAAGAPPALASLIKGLATRAMSEAQYFCTGAPPRSRVCWAGGEAGFCWRKPMRPRARRSLLLYGRVGCRVCAAGPASVRSCAAAQTGGERLRARQGAGTRALAPPPPPPRRRRSGAGGRGLGPLRPGTAVLHPLHLAHPVRMGAGTQCGCVRQAALLPAQAAGQRLPGRTPSHLAGMRAQASPPAPCPAAGTPTLWCTASCWRRWPPRRPRRQPAAAARRASEAAAALCNHPRWARWQRRRRCRAARWRSARR